MPDNENTGGRPVAPPWFTIALDDRWALFQVLAMIRGWRWL